MHKELVDSVLKLAAQLLENRVFELQDLGHGEVFRASLYDFSDDMVEIDRFADNFLNLVDLVLVVNVVQRGHFRCLVVPVKLNRWESEL